MSHVVGSQTRLVKGPCCELDNPASVWGDNVKQEDYQRCMQNREPSVQAGYFMFAGNDMLLRP
jgi:hypothetical protein